MSVRQKLIVVGNGMASVRFLETLLDLAPNRFDITVLGDEPSPGYNRIMLSPLLAGEISISETVLKPRQWYRDHKVTLSLGSGSRVTAIDRSGKLLATANGQVLSYDHLVLALGSRANIPDLPGSALNGVMAFRSHDDVNAMLQAAKQHKNAVVIGGGLLGLEAASALSQQGMSVTLVHNRQVLMNRQLDSVAGGLLQQELEQRGITFIKPARTVELKGCEGQVKQVVLDSGQSVPAELVVFATGVQPNKELAARAGLSCQRGILVDQHLQTSDASITAIGECVQFGEQTFGIVEPVYEQARVAAHCLAAKQAGKKVAFVSPTTPVRLKVTGVQLFSSGDFEGRPDDRILSLHDPHASVYRRLVIREQRIVGILLYGDTLDGNWYQSLLEQQEDISALGQNLLFGRQLTAAA
ncbi:NAD(P)/FAD-dependent oxidoreductase [Parendozoicomonas haliclonae]|uniref:Nitrite reductase [NAD(P)H] n=1 Tax=Parendozoicomonas haliclonae TaxID=1960125 RepID=A0A1X7AG36_9GAMM|nr:FAD-dependent oxidoreductase [Parendozoicomonas haliclonae]SMA37904.1 Nitrite reductase [NAD(P)H] [Parendozoicomonas haliclonae]